MDSEINLVRDLALILISAGVFTIISRALKQPLVIGYIIAGFLIGPHISIFPGISSTQTVRQWSDIGVIFMMFGLGLEFSFKKLLKVGSSALMIEGLNFIGLFIIGFATGIAMKWTMMESVFLGGLISMSSTAVVLKVYDDMGLKDKPFAGTVFGVLVVEDLVAVLLMVIYSTLAVSKTFDGGKLVFSLLKMAFFLILWFVVGLYLIPSLLKRTHKYLNDEILLIISVGLCFGMVAFANAVGFSSALGAFVMGSILAETLEGERIDRLTLSLKNLFSAIFFVSVGMMLDPKAIAQNYLAIIILTVVVVVGQLIVTTFSSLVAGKGLSNALKISASLAQVGEFGFILAGLGLSLGVMRDFTYPVIVTTSVITTFLCPYLIRLSNPMEAFLRKKLPEKVLDRLGEREEAGKEESVAGKTEWKEFFKSYAIRFVLYGVILVALFIVSRTVFAPLCAKIFSGLSQTLQGVITAGATLILSLPFIYGMTTARSAEMQSARRLVREKQGNFWPVFVMLMLRVVVAVIYVILLIEAHVQLSGWIIPLILTVSLFAIFFAQRIARKHGLDFNRIEDQFLSNLNAKEDEAKRKAPVTESVRAKLSGYNVKIEAFTLSQNSNFIGRRLKDIPLRSETGASIVKIERGNKSILIPDGSEFLYPYDKVLVVGTEQQLEAFKKVLADSVLPSDNSAQADFTVEALTLGKDSLLTGKTLREVNLRAYACMVLSTMRGDDFIANPRPDYRFREDDVVWFAGEKSSLALLR